MLGACSGRARDEPAPCPPAPAIVVDAAPAPADAAIAVDAGPVAGAVPVEGDFVQRDVAFANGERIAELRIHYMTLGTLQKDAAGHATNAVLVMHGTTGSGQQFLQPQFAGELFGPGQPLDLTRYYVILPDDIGHGRSSKPSDGLRARFPHYGYADMVAAEHTLVQQGLGVDHLRLVMGTSMGCMHAWMWAEQWPTAMDAVMPLACLPVPIAGRNRQWRKLVIDGIEQDPAWRGGDYTSQPTGALRLAASVLAIAGSAPLEQQARLPTPEAADKDTSERAAKFIATHDANDVLYAVAASRDYDPSAALEAIVAPVVFVNSTDDFINPPELGIAEAQIKRVKRGRFVMIPATALTHGHGTHTWATFWKDELVKLLAESEPR
ncbi:MAG: alpha/beta fold hydrolase [Deltaproteobacteria bacterium]|nr:alpha/beta fold hydrolase [Deltaproteobacteria bacterium]